MAKVKERIDLSGEVCPYPVLYLEPKLKEMSSGEILEVTLDHVCAAEGVPTFAKNLGHEVLSVNMVESGVWRILIRVKG